MLFDVETRDGDHAIAQIVDNHPVAVPVQILGDAQHADGHLVELHAVRGAPHCAGEERGVTEVVDRRRVYQYYVVCRHSRPETQGCAGRTSYPAPARHAMHRYPDGTRE